jgi:hypothetical protein
LTREEAAFRIGPAADGKGLPMKRLVLAGCVFAAAFFAPGAAPGALINIDVLDDEYHQVADEISMFQANSPNLLYDWGGFAEDQTQHKHTVTQNRGLFDSGEERDHGQFEVKASVGKYKYFCRIHKDEGMRETVSVIPLFTEATADTVRVTWATEFTTTGKRFDVRYRVDGGDWIIWQKQTKKRTKVFGKNGKPEAYEPGSHDYEFSARSQKGKPSKHKRSGWSPPTLSS